MSVGVELGNSPRRGESFRERDALVDELCSRRHSARLHGLTTPAAPLSAAALAAHRDATFVWQPNPAEAWVGIGCAKRYAGAGAKRFEQIRRAVEADAEGAADVRVFGGFAFAPGAARDEWSPFGDATFVLPRMSHERAGERAALRLWVTDDELDDRARITRLVHDWQKLECALATLEPERGTRSEPVAVRDLAQDDWAGLVRDILATIEAGRAQKIVAARRAEFTFCGALSLSATLLALAERGSVATSFALVQGGRVFVGTTPERLIQKQGLELDSEALAGTFRSAGSHFSEELLRSPKEHSDHAPVLEAILHQLRPLCRELRYPAQPEMRELPDLLHLRTPITGTLFEPLHVLDLVERLHPTPAVGGVPTAQAVSWIGEREPAPRGWYAGPIGWFDGGGDGDFSVALRSGLLLGERALLYAGGGIVRGSEAKSEYAETDLKLRALYRSLRLS